MRLSKPLAALYIVAVIMLLLELRASLHRKVEITNHRSHADSERPMELTLIRRTSVDKVRLVRGVNVWDFIFIY